MNQYKVDLTPQQQADVARGLKVLSDLATEIDKAENCGVNCDAHKAMANDLRRQLEALYRTYVGKSTTRKR